MGSEPSSWRSQFDGAEEALNLTLFGSPAPRCVRQSPKPTPKPKKSAKMNTRPLVLPANKIIMLQERLTESMGCDLLSDRESSLASSHRDFSLDLSSVTDSAHETDSSDDSISPARQIKQRVPVRSENKGYWRYDSSRSKYTTPISTNTSRPSSSFHSESHRLPSSTKTTSATSRRSSDLICLYVDTVNNTQLAKYFRPCITCQQTTCECPPQQLMERPNSQCSEFSQFLMERRFQKNPSEREEGRLSEPDTSENAIDSGNSTLQLDETSRSSLVSRRHVSLSLMQLSTAAQCARILADSLDSILQLARDEVTTLAKTPSEIPAIRNVDDLQSALETLKKTRWDQSDSDKGNAFPSKTEGPDVGPSGVTDENLPSTVHPETLNRGETAKSEDCPPTNHWDDRELLWKNTSSENGRHFTDRDDVFSYKYYRET